MVIYVLIDYEHDVYGVYYSEEDAYDAARKAISAEGFAGDELDDELCDWSVVARALV
jgi:hypothetical protein